jgi:hypothetical protein
MSTPTKNSLTKAQKQNRIFLLSFVIATPILLIALILAIVDASQYLM